MFSKQGDCSHIKRLYILNSIASSVTSKINTLLLKYASRLRFYHEQNISEEEGAMRGEKITRPSPKPYILKKVTFTIQERG